MVRGNWQKRVETAEARRKEAKQRKQKSEDKRIHKQWMQQLLKQLDDVTPTVVHVWTDVLAHNIQSLMDIIDNQDEKKGGRKNRSNSFDVNEGRKKGRNRSNSNADKKQHPRSKEQQQDENNENSLILCSSHFFTGKCQQLSRKKGACRFMHYGSAYKTLADVVSEDLQEIQNSVDDEGAMPMVYHFSVSGKEDWGAAISSLLTDKEMKLSNVVYLAVNSTLVYDQNRGGPLFADGDALAVALGDARKERRISVAGDLAHFDRLPGSVLDLVLRFLPDSAIAILPQVCKVWKHEVDQLSLEFWRHVLTRRRWPLPEVDKSNSRAARLRYHSAFMEHYSVMRDVMSIRAGSCGTLGARKRDTSGEVCCSGFGDAQQIVSIRLWSPGRILVASGHDCSLNLFECANRSDGNCLFFKELVTLRADPYRSTRKRMCYIIDMAVDNEFIGCLCDVTSSSVETHANILTLISRDDFLVSDSQPEGPLDESLLKVVDIGEAVLNYILSSDGTNDVVVADLYTVTTFLEGGGRLGEIDVKASRNLVSCGYGRFLVEVTLSLTNPGQGIDVFGRKLVLFSAAVEAIVWMGNSCPLDAHLLTPNEEVTMASVHRPAVAGGSRTACTIATTGQTLPGTMILYNIDSTGTVFECDSMACAIGDLQDGMSMKRRICVTSGHVCVATTMSVANGADEPHSVQSSVSIHERDSVESDDPKVLLYDNLTVQSLACIRDAHVVLFCELNVVPEEEDVQAVDGHWFGPVGDENSSKASGLWVIALHVPSCTEVYRSSLVPVNSATREVVSLDDCQDTVAVWIAEIGLVMSGPSVRDVAAQSMQLSEDDILSSAKKKKKRRSKGNSKDGFARGMSLRG